MNKSNQIKTKTRTSVVAICSHCVLFQVSGTDNGHEKYTMKVPRQLYSIYEYLRQYLEFYAELSLSEAYTRRNKQDDKSKYR